MPLHSRRPTTAAVLLLAALLCPGPLRAQEKPDVELEIKGSGFEKVPLALPSFPAVSGGDNAADHAASIHQVIWDDLAFSGYFELIDRNL
ncbi:MAG: hypothetical protein ACE5ID_10990, partial [Acidobacteriota bacterium]